MIELLPITASDQKNFELMAIAHFSELNPAFVPQKDWEENYFKNILRAPECFFRWIVNDKYRVGFILFGLEQHRFLPRRTGVIYELYVSPEFRRRGVAKAAAKEAIRQLWTYSPSKVQLEIVEGQIVATALWRSLGFQKVTERFVLPRGVL
jgi:ribosomal protein S18 acetylase RimI-like enzyme